MCETSLFEILFTNTTLVSFIIVHTLGSHQCVYRPFEPGFVQMSSQLFTLGLTQFTHYSPGPGCMPTPCAGTSQVPRPTLRCQSGNLTMRAPTHSSDDDGLHFVLVMLCKKSWLHIDRFPASRSKWVGETD